MVRAKGGATRIGRVVMVVANVIVVAHQSINGDVNDHHHNHRWIGVVWIDCSIAVDVLLF